MLINRWEGRAWYYLQMSEKQIVNEESTVEIDGQTFEIVKATRLREGMVIKSGNVYGRVGPKQSTLEEQIHTEALYNRGFPVSEVVSSGDVGDGEWYFTEKSLGDKTFHEMFNSEYQQNGQVSSATFDAYLAVIDAYTNAQVKPSNHSDISLQNFIERFAPNSRIYPSYIYFGYDFDEYKHALKLASEKLQSAAMGVLQFDLNPFNILEGGVIDFELVGYGPIGLDVLISARWGSSWFTDYPSRYPVAYKLSQDQIAKSDTLVDDIATNSGLEKPTNYLQEFLLFKSAWALQSDEGPKTDMPADKLAFGRFRANVLHATVGSYLQGKEIDPLTFPSIPGGEINT